MSLFSQLTEKPWVATDGPAEDLAPGRMSSMPTARFGLRFVLITVTIVFSAIVIVYTERMAFNDWRPMPETWLLWLNTVILVLSSVALQRASSCARTCAWLACCLHGREKVSEAPFADHARPTSG